MTTHQEIQDHIAGYDRDPDGVWLTKMVSDAVERFGGVKWEPIATAPNNGAQVLLRSKKGAIANGHWMTWGVGAWVWPYAMMEPTHWMPLPPPPKEK